MGVAALLAGAAAGCTQSLTLAHDDSPTVLAHQQLSAPDPSRKGTFVVRTLYYGSGTDKQRAIFRDSVAIRTAVVDGSPFATPQPKSKEFREAFWGFDTKRMPVNARVWYPEGAGPFPLVLIVHGNHDMEDFSDPGYAYLGELLASRGFIMASVDENFLNGDMRAENDARGWMLLQHLKVWRALNDSAGGRFYHKVDMRHIALMGHSRGGEAVAVAAAFNRLKHYPDDATVKFDFGFDIKSLVAIAPIDGQYKPADMPTPLEDVNYLVVHGSHDGDVSSFSGNRQYERVHFQYDDPAPRTASDTALYFKSAFYVYRANHGQWNTVWNNHDNGPRSARSLDLRGLLAPEEQRRFAEVVITAFLESTLNGRREYLPLFRDHRVAGGWLPKTMYITRFEDSGFHTLADFQEDVDVETGSVRGVRITGDSLASWKEAVVPMRWKGNDFGTNAVWLGWNNRIAGPDSTKMGQPASYTISLPDSLRAAWQVDSNATLEFSLAPTNVVPPRRKPFVDSTKKANVDSAKRAAPSPAPDKVKPDTTPMDLSVELVDAQGVKARVALSTYGAVRRPLETHVYRRADRDEQRFANEFEYVLQSYAIPVADFVRAEPRFDGSRVTAVRWVFDRNPQGTVILDDVGFSRMDRGFISPR
jgi:dienelactone hydrolase